MHSSTKYCRDWGLATASWLTAFSTAVPVRIRLMGTSSGSEIIGGRGRYAALIGEPISTVAAGKAAPTLKRLSLTRICGLGGFFGHVPVGRCSVGELLSGLLVLLQGLCDLCHRCTYLRRLPLMCGAAGE